MDRIEELKKKLAEIGWTEQPSDLIGKYQPIGEKPKRKYRRSKKFQVRSEVTYQVLDYINAHMHEDYTQEKAANDLGIKLHQFGNAARRLQKHGLVPKFYNSRRGDLTTIVNKQIQKASRALEGVSLAPTVEADPPVVDTTVDRIDQLAWEFIKAEECTDLLHFIKWTKENYGR